MISQVQATSDYDREDRRPVAGPGSVDSIWSIKNEPLRIDKFESWDLLLSPWTGNHLSERRIAHHNWIGCWLNVQNGERIKPAFTTFRPYRVLCPQLSDVEIAGKAPCAVCEVLAKLRPTWKRGMPITVDWRNTLTSILGPTFSAKLEVLPIARDGRPFDSGIRFLTVNWREALAAFRGVDPSVFAGQIWSVTRDEHGLHFKQTGKTSDRKPVWGKTFSVHVTQDEHIRIFANMALASQGQMPRPGRADEIQLLLPEAVLVPLVWGLKRPPVKRYFDLGPKWMKQWGEYERVLDHHSIAFAGGPVSDHLCSLDLDLAGELERVLKLNTWARRAMRIHGRRGTATLFRVRGAYNAKVHRITANNRHDNVGELRLGKCLQTVSGLHPSGISYRIENPGMVPIITIEDFAPPWHWDEIKPEREPEKRRIYQDQSACALDLGRIKFMRDSGAHLDAQCPCCAQRRKDTAHDNLRIWKRTWGFCCIAGCSRDDILSVAGRDGWKIEDDDYENDE